MPTKARGPLLEDINRAIKAAQKHGWMEASVKFPNGCEIVLRKNATDPAAAPPKPNGAERPKARWGLDDAPSPPATEAEPLDREALYPEMVARERARETQRQERAAVVGEILRDGAWNFRQPLKALAAELAERGFMNWRYDSPSRPMYTTDVKEVLEAWTSRGK
jgi:hypothetical protein